MPELVFDVGTDPGAEPVTIRIQGTDIHGAPIAPRVFGCQPEIQGEVYAEFVGKQMAAQQAIAEGRVSDASMTFPEIARFMRHCLNDADVERFDELTHGKEVIVRIETLGEILKGLMEVYAGRPLARSIDSPGGTSSNATILTGVVPPPAPPIPAVSALNGSAIPATT